MSTTAVKAPAILCGKLSGGGALVFVAADFVLATGVFFATGLDFFAAAALRGFLVTAIFFLAAFFLVEAFIFLPAFEAGFLRVFLAIPVPQTLPKEFTQRA